MTQITIEREALDLALEALEKLTDTEQTYEALDLGDKAITAIKQVRALDKKAENARELGLDYGPVAWMYELIIDGEVCNVECTNVNWNPEYQPFGRAGIDFVESGKVTKTPLYTTPPAAPVPVPLTNTEFGEQWFKQTGRIMGTDKQLLLQAKRVTEAAHGITEKGQP
jgi:hypothetical protein